MEKSIDDIMNEMNDRAKAEGRYLGKAFWEIPRAQGSILDVPSTPEAEQRLAALRARRLERRKKKTEGIVVPNPIDIEQDVPTKVGLMTPAESGSKTDLEFHDLNRTAGVSTQ